MKAIFMGKHKRSAVGALQHLIERGCEVVAVVAPPEPGEAAPQQRLDLAAAGEGLRMASDRELHAEIASGDLADVDLVLSFLFWRRIERPLIDSARVACLNFHPAPLPDMRGLGGYNVAILEEFEHWGVSAHFVDEAFDTGDLVRVDRFAIDQERETAFSLDLKSQEQLLAVYRDVIDAVMAGEELPRSPQGEGRYVTREEFEGLRRVPADESPEKLARRIRAFWYPPHDGATIQIAGQTVTVVSQDVLAQAAAANRAAGHLP